MELKIHKVNDEDGMKFSWFANNLHIVICKDGTSASATLTEEEWRELVIHGDTK